MRLAALSLLLFVLAGCGTARPWHVYGQSGQLYQAPELCQAVAQCAQAGEKTCYYPQSDTYTCGDKKTAQ
jgi:hypothetical protein